jgi:hypothetical protein
VDRVELGREFDESFDVPFDGPDLDHVLEHVVDILMLSPAEREDAIKLDTWDGEICNECTEDLLRTRKELIDYLDANDGAKLITSIRCMIEQGAGLRVLH